MEILGFPRPSNLIVYGNVTRAPQYHQCHVDSNYLDRLSEISRFDLLLLLLVAASLAQLCCG